MECSPRDSQLYGWYELCFQGSITHTQVAVLYEIIVIGEDANRLSAEFRAKHSTIPWKDIIGIRNVLAHQYDKVDSEVVWDAIQQDIPELMALLKPLLST